MTYTNVGLLLQFFLFSHEDETLHTAYDDLSDARPTRYWNWDKRTRRVSGDNWVVWTPNGQRRHHQKFKTAATMWPKNRTVYAAAASSQWLRASERPSKRPTERERLGYTIREHHHHHSAPKIVDGRRTERSVPLARTQTTLARGSSIGGDCQN